MNILANFVAVLWQYLENPSVGGSNPLGRAKELQWVRCHMVGRLTHFLRFY